MFGLGMGEIVIIAIVALLFIGPDKLPGAAKSIGKGIRDLRKQTRDLQDTIEKDTEFGDAVRELRGALRGDETPPPLRRPGKPGPAPTADAPAGEPVAPSASGATGVAAAGGDSPAREGASEEPAGGRAAPLAAVEEAADSTPSLIRGAVGTVARDGEDERG